MDNMVCDANANREAEAGGVGHSFFDGSIEAAMRFLGVDMNPKEVTPKKPKQRVFHRPILTTKLAEIFSVSIHGSNSSFTEIYGRISVIVRGDHRFDIFSRTKDEPEHVRVDDGSLFLTAPSSREAVIVPSPEVRLDVLLFDKSRGDMLVAKGEVVLDRGDIIDCAEENRVEIVQGEHGCFARVDYATFPYAVVANVDVLFFSKDDSFDFPSGPTPEGEYTKVINNVYEEDNCDFDEDEVQVDDLLDSLDENDYIEYDECECGNGSVAHVFGSVRASSDYKFPDSVYGKHDKSLTLFRKPLEQSVEVKSGGFINLSRSVVAVPAYSSLNIEVDISDCETLLPIARDIVKFKPQYSQIFKKDIIGENGRIRVRVTWSHEWQHFTVKKQKRSSRSALTPDLGDEEQEKRQKLPLEQYSSSSFSSRGMPPVGPAMYLPTPLVEVSSVVVCRKDFKPFSFGGKISLEHWPRIDIFHKDKSCPQASPAFGTRAVIRGGSRSFEAVDELSFYVDLRDTDGSVISYGYLFVSDSNITRLANKPVCSLIQGFHGFAAVHYAVFPDGISAVVGVKLFGNSVPVRVYGKIVAYCGAYEFTSSYDMEHYRSVLYEMSAEDDLPEQNSGDSIQLLKSVVSLPRKSSLIIEADLFVSPATTSFDCKSHTVSNIRGRTEMNPNGEASWQIKGEFCCIEVSIKWLLEYSDIVYSCFRKSDL